MDEQFVRDRITELRIANGKSEREMSLDDKRVELISALMEYMKASLDNKKQ